MTIASVFISVFCGGDSAVFAGVGMSGSSGSKEHLNGYNHQHGSHGNDTGHGRIPLVPKVGKAWIGQGDECCRKEVDECGCDEDACAEMSGDEEEIMGYGKTREPAGYDWERTSYCHMSLEAE